MTTGILRQAPLREREVFDRLRMSVRLAPGEMLVLMSLPDAGSRLGHYFHTVDSADGPQQKLILIRLAEVPPSDTFADLASRIAGCRRSSAALTPSGLTRSPLAAQNALEWRLRLPVVSDR